MERALTNQADGVDRVVFGTEVKELAGRCALITTVADQHTVAEVKLNDFVMCRVDTQVVFIGNSEPDWMQSPGVQTGSAQYGIPAAIKGSS
jgi:hypothetical protein